MAEKEKFIKDVGDQRGDKILQEPIGTVLNKGYSCIDGAARRKQVEVARALPREDLNMFSPSTRMGPRQGSQQKEDKYNGNG